MIDVATLFLILESETTMTVLAFDKVFRIDIIKFTEVDNFAFFHFL